MPGDMPGGGATVWIDVHMLITSQSLFKMDDEVVAFVVGAGFLMIAGAVQTTLKENCVGEDCRSCCKEASTTVSIVLGARLDTAYRLRPHCAVDRHSIHDKKTAIAKNSVQFFYSRGIITCTTFRECNLGTRKPG